MSETPILSLQNVNAHYGAAHVVQDVSFDVHDQPVSVIGRNGMGKTSLCRAIMNLDPPNATGTILLDGEPIGGKPPYVIARAGIGYVPQGRKLFQSLSVDEHLRMIKTSRTGRWDTAAVYNLFPRLAERKKISATQLSGGEQQMLAIGRALLVQPRLLLMDEPSEGLAPRIVEELVDTLKGFVDEGVGVLLIEQNLGVATSVAERLVVMVAGAVFTETTATEITNSPELQQRFLGVTPTGHE
ncbi:MAG: ABC transporter ATP-binding protein [Thermoleophilia bacterium]|nr:ABC transporter ATP-binding protein [Thermoleophilia bacterium]PHX80528.1 MAG: ABC transporter ATP-binding protein [Thermoleophilia bacterium]